VIAIANEAHRRLNGRYRRMTTRGKEHNKVVVAIVRDLVGFPWATLAVEERASLSWAEDRGAEAEPHQ